jgi:hypothetical protein
MVDVEMEKCMDSPRKICNNLYIYKIFKKHYEHIYELYTFYFCKYLRIKQSLDFIFSSFENKI